MAADFDAPQQIATISESTLHIEFPANQREPSGATPQHFLWAIGTVGDANSFSYQAIVMGPRTG